MKPDITMTPVVDWQEIAPPDFATECVKCGRKMTADDFRRQRIVAIVGHEGMVACCVDHVLDLESEEYRSTVRLMAQAKSAQLNKHKPGEESTGSRRG